MINVEKAILNQEMLTSTVPLSDVKMSKVVLIYELARLLQKRERYYGVKVIFRRVKA